MTSVGLHYLQFCIACLALQNVLHVGAFVHSTSSQTSATTRKSASSMLRKQQNSLTFVNNMNSMKSSRSTTAAFTELMMEVIKCDVAIIGGGPAGCTCALYTARSNLSTVILDKNPAAGALAITSTIANYPGVESTMSGTQLLDNMRQQAIDYGADYRQAQVFMVEFDEEKEIKTIYTPDLTIEARSLVLATGALGRKPTFKGEAEYLGKGVSYCATCDGAFYQESPVAVVGVTKEAIEEAEFLTKFASTVHWITRSPIDPANAEAMELLAHENVKHWVDTRLTVIEGDVSGVTGIHLMQKGHEETEHLELEGVFIYDAGSKPITDYITSKIIFEDDGGVKVDNEMSTNVPGVYGIGDIRNTPFKQVVVAASDGCIAAMSVDRYLKGSKSIKVDWKHN